MDLVCYKVYFKPASSIAFPCNRIHQIFKLNKKTKPLVYFITLLLTNAVLFQSCEKDRIFVEYNTWKFSEPLGTYGNSDEYYPGLVREHGIGFGYQRFLWKGLFSTVQATPFLKKYIDDNDEKIQNGFKVYMQFALGYRVEFLKNRFYIEPAIALKYWPIDTNFPEPFAEIEKGNPNTKFEPSLNCGFKF